MAEGAVEALAATRHHLDTTGFSLAWTWAASPLQLFLAVEQLVCDGTIDLSADILYRSYTAMEEVFLNHVRKQWLVKPQISSVGSCCLVGIINEGVLYIANTGDSCVVPGRVERGAKDIKAVQLSSEHNASFLAVRDELRQVHPNDPRIMALKHKV